MNYKKIIAAIILWVFLITLLFTSFAIGNYSIDMGNWGASRPVFAIIFFATTFGVLMSLITSDK